MKESYKAAKGKPNLHKVTANAEHIQQHLDKAYHNLRAMKLAKGKKVILFATSRAVSSELNALRSQGLLIFDIRKIKEFYLLEKRNWGIKQK